MVELEKVVELYPEFRLVVVQSFSLYPFISKGRNYNRSEENDKTLFIYHDINSDHYVSIQGYKRFMQSLARTSVQICYECCGAMKINVERSTCFCDGAQRNVRERQKIPCDFCGEIIFKNKKKDHRCGHVNCKYCPSFYKRSDYKKHRCPIIASSNNMNKKFAFDETSMNELDEEPYELWAWDIESEMVYVRNGDEYETQEFYEKDEDGFYVTDEDGRLKVSYIRRCAQLCNYIYCRNVFSGEEFEFTNLEDFIKFASVTRNNGKNFFYAHNSSGYDSRLLYEAACRIHRTVSSPLLRGSKFMKIMIGKHTFFHDSMLHLPGSLKRQGQAFNLNTTKGDFPHGFSFRENINYIGPIPDMKYFPDRFGSSQELLEFKEWHREKVETNYVWNYIEERKSYCRNDVYMLAEIMRLYHENTLALFKDYPHLQVSPWFFTTVAGYHHNLQLHHLHIQQDFKKMTNDEINEYSENTWCGLDASEYYFARSALRGGMTNICKFISETKIHYVDIQSSYPSCQLSKDNLYPVGPPIIEIHDKSAFPCLVCPAKMSDCNHSYEQRKTMYRNSKISKMEIVEVDIQDIETYCQNFTGIISVDIDPPSNLYHPLIQEFDDTKKKVIGSLTPIKKTTIPCITLKRAIEVGYKVKKIYRADRYKLSESKWRNGLLGDMYLAKMKYAGEVPLEEHDRMKSTFKEKFDIDLGDMTLWENNPVRKHTSKILINCGWGKHAESVDHMQSVAFLNDGREGMEFYELVLMNRCEVSGIQNIGSNILFRFNENRMVKSPNLHKSYLPVAVYVTAYGRLALWNELVKVDPPGTRATDLRVLMYDTDSIVYECKHESKYHITEGDCLGDWETEKIEAKGNGIQSFYSIGPKSYSIVPVQGKPLIKLKGASLDLAHSRLMTPTVMKQMVEDRRSVELPQMTLDYRMGSETKALSFRNFRKVVQFNENDCKGEFCVEDFRVYPIGFNKT